MPPKKKAATSKKSYTRPAEAAKVKQELEDASPIVVRFYRATCPACHMSAPAWERFCSDMASGPYRIVEVEEAAIPSDVLAGISAFPTYAKHDGKGSSHAVGAILDPAQIKTKLGIPS